MIEDELSKSNESFGFEIPERLDQAIAGIGDQEIRQSFIDTVKNEGLESALTLSPAFIRGIEAKFGALAERTVDDGEKKAFQLMQRVIPQIALAEMLHAAGEGDEASGVLDDVYTMLSQEIDENLAHREYFEALLRLV